MCHMAYHFSDPHLATGDYNRLMLFGFIVNTNQLVERVANNTVNVFNRGWTHQQIQAEANSALVLTKSEQKQRQQWFKVSFKDGINSLFQNISWTKGWLWSFNAPFKLNSLNFSNKNFGKWVEDNSGFNTYLAEINKYRKSTNTEDINMDDEDAANITG